MNLIDLPSAAHDPLEPLFAFHRRLERRLADLTGLQVRLEVGGIDAEASAAAAAIVECVASACTSHHRAQEHDLLPLIERRIPGEEALAAFRELRARLGHDHREIERAWHGLRRPLEAIAEGIPRRLRQEDIHYFRALCAVHISLEDSSLHLLALRHLQPRDRHVLGQRIRERRSRALRAA